jgi:hypothetical protein
MPSRLVNYQWYATSCDPDRREVIASKGRNKGKVVEIRVGNPVLSKDEEGNPTRLDIYDSIQIKDVPVGDEHATLRPTRDKYGIWESRIKRVDNNRWNGRTVGFASSLVETNDLISQIQKKR